MSKELFEAGPDYDMAHDIGRGLFMAGVVLSSVIFCAGIVVGCLLTWGLG